MINFSYGWVLSFSLLALVSQPQHKVLGADIIDNTLDGSATLFSQSYPLSTNERGYAFTVLNTPITVDNITFGLTCLVSGTAEIGVKLYTGVGGNGGTLIYDSGTSLVSLNTISNGAGYYSYAVNWQLNSNQTYTVMVYNGTPSSPSFPHVAETSQPLSIDSKVTGVGFFNNTNLVPDNYAIRIQASVPEPSALLTGVLSVIAMVLRMRKKYSHKG